jgi:uncharacterized protein (TIGR01244 family)
MIWMEHSMNITELDAKLSISPQVMPTEMDEIALSGFKGIINNRPDDEAPDQPRSEDLEVEARRNGLSYWHIPIVPGQATEADARAFAEAVEQAGGPVLAFCRTGNRASALWKMAQQLP